MCRCAERRVAIFSGARAVLKGDGETVRDATRFVVRSSVEDIRGAFSASVAAARARLARR